jgi:N-formylglutamate amidohydrolase
MSINAHLLTGSLLFRLLPCLSWLLFLFLQADVLAETKVGPEEWLTFWAGSLPIILAAPHGGRQAIPGVSARIGAGVAQFVTGRDHNTAELARAVAMSLNERFGAKPFLVIAEFGRRYIDVNRPDDQAYESAGARLYYAAYHDALEQACVQIKRRWGRGLLLDIHGQGAHHDAIYRGTQNGRSVNALTNRFGRDAISGAGSIVGYLACHGYRVLPDPTGNDIEKLYSGGYTTQLYGSRRGGAVDAIQLEFGATLRSRANIEKTASDLADAIAVFSRQYLPLESSATPELTLER